jgi:glucose-1-phosphate adenylyltransferase
MNNTIAVILGGGQGTRLFPLTQTRSKPAVPIGGKYRLIDIPISNCLNSNINRIFILTQFNSASLNKHVNQTYRFDNFHKGFVDILAAEQSVDNTEWFQGTADAVRKSLRHITSYFDTKYILILSGDQIYTMDYRVLFNHHIENNSEITIPLISATRDEAKSFGIVKMDKENIVDFLEKPKDEKLLDEIKSTKLIKEKFPNIGSDKEYLASMGIYLFNIETLIELLSANCCKDFGKEIIPMAIKSKKVGGYLFNGYWEDVGNIRTFWQANLDFASITPKFDFYKSMIYTNARNLPASRILSCTISESLICEGTVIKTSKIKNSVVGIRTIIRENSEIEDSVIMGADFFESSESKKYNREHGIVSVGIGKNTIIKEAIVDKNSRIGDNCQIINKNKLKTFDGGNYYIREGIIIIPKNSVILDNTII